MKRIVRVALAVILITLATSFAYVAFFIEYEGTVVQGDFRDIHIGSSKSDVIDRIQDSEENHSITLRISGYYDSEGEYQFVGAPAKKLLTESGVIEGLYASDRWVLFSSSVLGEGMTLEFTDDRLNRIKFIRAPLDP